MLRKKKIWDNTTYYQPKSAHHSSRNYPFVDRLNLKNYRNSCLILEDSNLVKSLLAWPLNTLGVSGVQNFVLNVWSIVSQWIPVCQPNVLE